MSLVARIVAAIPSSLLAACVPDAADYFTSPVEPFGPADIFFSEYVDGSEPADEALEIYNAAAAALQLDGCEVWIWHDETNVVDRTIDLVGFVAVDDVFVICDRDFDDAGACDLPLSGIGLDGGAAIALRCGDVSLDHIGHLLSYGSPDLVKGVGTDGVTLRRSCAVTWGDVRSDDPFDRSLEWLEFPVDDFGGLGSHDCP